MDDRAVAALEAAVAVGDGLGARRVMRSFPDQGQRELALDQLARLASGGSTLAVELMVEFVDELGVARRAVRAFLLDEAAVDDVTQDTLITLAEAIGSYRGDAKLTTWLHQLARYRAIDYLRRQRATVALDEREHSAVMRISSMISTRETVRQLLDHLPTAYRDVVVLREVERLPYVEVANRLGRNLHTVKSQIARGRALLAAMVQEEGLA
jgi:RNA polymerase sigma factor (sigma-70 family)